MIMISAQPNELEFFWQLEVQLNNFKEWGYDYHILIFMKEGIPLEEWKRLETKYKVKIFFYYDKNIETIARNFLYPPIIRPFLLKEHFKLHKNLEKEAIFYIDSDVIFTKYLDLSELLKDDIIYMSYTGNKDRTDNYLNYNYFLKKENYVREDKISLFKRIDVINSLSEMFSIPMEGMKNFEYGGAQSLLKNIDWKFWEEVFENTLILKTFFSNVNQQVMKGATPLERENNGYQSWCSDMWALLFTLWKRGHTTKCPKILDFLWSNTPIDRWDECYIYHDAGGPEEGTFNKREYKERIPNNLSLSSFSPKYCSYNYVKHIINTYKN